MFWFGSTIQETDESRKQMGEVKDRHEEFKNIEEDIVELTELYNELFELVANQGTTIPIIKYKTITAEETQTVWALTIAKGFYHRALAQKKMLGMIFTALCLIILIMSISASTSGSETEPHILIVDETPTIVSVTQACDPARDMQCVG